MNKPIIVTCAGFAINQHGHLISLNREANGYYIVGFGLDRLPNSPKFIIRISVMPYKKYKL